MGEFGDVMLTNQDVEEVAPYRVRSFQFSFVICATVCEIFQITEIDVITLLERVLLSSLSTIVTKEYALMAMIKLSTRFGQAEEAIRAPITVFGTNMNLELQQRSAEFGELLKKHGLRFGFFEFFIFIGY